MMLKKKALEKFRDAYPQMSYKPDHVRTKHFDGSREIHAYFDAVIDDKNANIQNELDAYLKKNKKATHKQILEFVNNKKESALSDKQMSNRYLSEDYMFCQWARNIGLKVWLCPWMELQHMGSFVFGGSLKDLGSIGAPATADPSKVGQNQNM